MEAQATTGPGKSRVAADEGVRTCRPAIVRRTRSDGADSEEPPASPEENIIRGED